MFIHTCRGGGLTFPAAVPCMGKFMLCGFLFVLSLEALNTLIENREIGVHFGPLISAEGTRQELN